MGIAHASAVAGIMTGLEESDQIGVRAEINAERGALGHRTGADPASKPGGDGDGKGEMDRVSGGLGHLPRSTNHHVRNHSTGCGVMKQHRISIGQ